MTKVLVVEDEVALLEQILEVLDFEGYEAIGAKDGRAGVQMARECAPDVILCDIMMPGFDGYSVLQALRDDPETAAIPFLFLTAKSAQSDVRQGMALGADDYIAKPFTHTELLSAIDARLKRHATIVKQQQKAVEQAQTKLSRMVMDELRVPVTSLDMVQEIVSQQMLQLPRHELQQLLDMLSSGRQRLTHLVEQLAFITRLETGVLSRETVLKNGSPMQIWPILAAAVNLGHRFVSRRPNVVIRFLDESDREAAVLVDEGALKHAFTELVANALDHSPEDSKVMVSQWQDKGSVWISVLNRDPGMERDAWERMVERFQQFDGEIQGRRGMGLAVARQIIEAHGGTLELVRDVSEGAQLLISLPLVED